MGRFGYLITEEPGPRISIFAVTTDLPLVVDNPVDIGVEDFCTFCKKRRMVIEARTLLCHRGRSTSLILQ